jgi:hypothetical protein
VGLVGHFKKVCQVGILEDVMICSFGSIDLNDILIGDVQMQYIGAEF